MKISTFCNRSIYLLINSSTDKKTTVGLKSIIPDETFKKWYFSARAFYKWQLFALVFVFTNSFKSITLKTDRMTIKDITRTVGVLVSGLFQRQVVLNLKNAVHFIPDVLNCGKARSNSGRLI